MSELRLKWFEHNPAWDYVEVIIESRAPIQWRYGNYERDAREREEKKRREARS